MTQLKEIAHKTKKQKVSEILGESDSISSFSFSPFYSPPSSSFSSPSSSCSDDNKKNNSSVDDKDKNNNDSKNNSDSNDNKNNNSDPKSNLTSQRYFDVIPSRLGRIAFNMHTLHDEIE